MVVAAAAGVDAAPRVPEALDQARLDRGMAVLEAPVQNEAAAAEAVGQLVAFAYDARQFVRRQDAVTLPAFRVHAAGRSVGEADNVRKSARSGTCVAVV